MLFHVNRSILRLADTMRENLSDIPLALHVPSKVLLLQVVPHFVFLCVPLRVPIRPKCNAIVPASDSTFDAVAL
jgi:hypothetical protein